MSVPNQIPIKESIANGVTTVFPYDFYVLSAADLAVYAGGTAVTPDKYVVAGIGQTQGGSVTFTVAPLNGTRITLKRETPVRRDTQYVNNGDLLAETFNADFDRLWLSLQEQRANFSSSMTKPVGVGNWNAMGFAVENLKDGSQPQDAATLKQLLSVNGSAGVSASAAAQSAADAALSRQAAGTSEGNAATSRQAAEQAKNAAGASATQAAASATQADSSAQAAAAARTTADQRATDASVSAAAAAQSEVNAGSKATAAAQSAELARQFQPNTALQLMVGRPLTVTDLNDLSLPNGVWDVPGTVTNAPAAGTLTNIALNGTSVVARTQFMQIADNGIRMRTYQNGAWSTWRALLHDQGVVPVVNGGTGGNTQAAARSGLGLGSAAVLDAVGNGSSAATNGKIPILGSTFSATPDAYSLNFASSNTPILAAATGSSSTPLRVSNGTNNSAAAAMTFVRDGSFGGYFGLDQDNVFRIGGFSFGNKSYRLWTEQNTTVDGNGFIKKASPIVRVIYGDTVSPETLLDNGFSVAGSGAANAEAEGVSIIRNSVGSYTVSGAVGLAETGWTIEVPQDNNGNRLCFVETSVADSGDISVRVYKRKFDIDTAMIIAGAAMDIPAGRWLDLRLQMPADSVYIRKSAQYENEMKDILAKEKENSEEEKDA